MEQDDEQRLGKVMGRTIPERIINEIKIMLLSLSFISRIPVKLPSKMAVTDRDIKSCVRCFSLIGYIPGLIFALGRMTHHTMFYLISIAVSFWLFDLFHFDGFLDTFDGFFNQGTKEKRLEIMSRGNVGPFAVFFGMLYMIAFWEMFKITLPMELLYASVFGRLSMTTLLHISHPSKEEGLGAFLYPTSKINLLISFLCTTPLLFFRPHYFVVAAVVSQLTALYMKYISEKKIGGITGDVLGATSLLGQMFVLVGLLAV